MILRQNRLISSSTTWLGNSPILLTEGVQTLYPQMSNIKAGRESVEIRTSLHIDDPNCDELNRLINID